MEMSISWEKMKKYLHYRQLRASSKIILQGLNKKGVWVRAKALPKERVSHQDRIEKTDTPPRHGHYEIVPKRGFA